jgi:hypothetical protein
MEPLTRQGGLRQVTLVAMDVTEREPSLHQNSLLLCRLVYGLLGRA